MSWEGYMFDVGLFVFLPCVILALVLVIRRPRRWVSWVFLAFSVVALIVSWMIFFIYLASVT